MVDAQQKISSQGHPDAPALTVVVADDDPDMRLYVTQCLGSLGERLTQVLEAANGLEALHLARSISVDLVIADVVMPHLNGPDLQTQLAPERPDMKVLFMSGYTDGAIESGVDTESGFIQKPFTPSEIALRVREALDRAAAA